MQSGNELAVECLNLWRQLSVGFQHRIDPGRHECNAISQMKACLSRLIYQKGCDILAFNFLAMHLDAASDFYLVRRNVLGTITDMTILQVVSQNIRS